MNIRASVAALLLVVVVSCATTLYPDRPVTFHAAGGFSAESNPTPLWSYGWSEQLGSELHLYEVVGPKNVPEVVSWTRGETDPNVYFNESETIQRPDGTMTIQPGQLAFHPGPSGEYSVIRWTAPKSGRCTLSGVFEGLSGYGRAPVTTTEVAIVHEMRILFSSEVNLNGKGNSTSFALDLLVAEGDSIDFTVGPGNNGFAFDSTALDALVRLD